MTNNIKSDLMMNLKEIALNGTGAVLGGVLLTSLVTTPIIDTSALPTWMVYTGLSVMTVGTVALAGKAIWHTKKLIVG